MPNQDAILRNFLLPRSGPGTRTVWLVFFSTLMTILVMGTVAMYFWYESAQTRIADTHPVVLEWSADSVALELTRIRAEIARIADSSEPGLGKKQRVAHLQRFLAGQSAFAGFVYLDPSGEIRATAGRGTGYEKLLDALSAKRGGDPEVFEVLAAKKLRRDLAGIRAPSLRRLDRGTERAWLVASAPLPGRRANNTSTLHAVVRSERLAEQLRPDLLTIGSLHLVGADGRIFASAGDVTSESMIPVDSLRAGTTPHLEVPWNARNDWTVRSALALDELELTITAEQPVFLAFKPIWVASSWLFAAGAATLGCLTLLAAFAALSSTRKLQTLLDGFRALIDDDYAHRLPSGRSRGQLPHLFRAFNAVADRLAKNKSRTDTESKSLVEQNKSFQKLHEQLSKLSVTDGLTDLHNHRFFQDQLGKEIKRLSRTAEGLAILIIDIDDFKKMNDTYGHAAGDEALKQIARILRESVRDTDVLARYGGEEFVVIATATKTDGARLLAEKLRTSIAETSFIVDDSKRPRRVTVSIGVAEYSHSRTGLFSAADAALYRAKEAGKNCVMTAEATNPI